MGSMFGSIEMARNALQVNQLGLQITGHNIANVNTPSYTRQEVNLEDKYYQTSNFGAFGFGVGASTIEGYRNQYAIRRIFLETQESGSLNARSSGLEQLESIAAPQYSSITEGMRSLFAAFQSLSANPTDMALRQDVLSKANLLTDKFHTAYEQIQSFQSSLDQVVQSQTTEINDLTARIAELNQEVFENSALPGGNASDPRDQRDEAVKNLSELIGVNVMEDTRGILTIQTESGGLLVSGTQSYDLSTSPGAGGMASIFLDGTDITGTITKGKIGGLIEVRDGDIPAVLGNLDRMATTLIDQVNAIHFNGYNLNNVNNNNFFQAFVPPGPDPYTGAARAITVEVADPAGIAASSMANEPGNNVVALALVGVEKTAYPVLGNRTLSQYWQSAITGLAVSIQTNKGDLRANESSLTQLQNLRDSESGVNLDEEGVNMITYQRSYEAIARYLKVMDELTGELLQIK